MLSKNYEFIFRLRPGYVQPKTLPETKLNKILTEEDYHRIYGATGKVTVSIHGLLNDTAYTAMVIGHKLLGLITLADGPYL
jgi:hypothetical protein